MKVLTIDDHILFRQCMVDFLETQDDITVVGQASSPEQALNMANELKPDLALVDINLGGEDGLALAEQIPSVCPECSVVVLTASQDDKLMLRAVHIGTKGYLVKDIEPENLVTELRRVMDGELAFPYSFLIEQVKNTFAQQNKAKQQGVGKTLTVRELDVLQLVTDGLTDKEIALTLLVSENTVKNHMKNIRRKLGVTNRVLATLAGIQLGIIKKDPNDNLTIKLKSPQYQSN